MSMLVEMIIFMHNSQLDNSGAIVPIVAAVQTIPHVILIRKTWVSLPVFLYRIKFLDVIDSFN